MMRAAWLGQTDDRIYDVTIARHQTLCSHTRCHPHPRLPGVHQSIKQAVQTSIALYLASESDPSHCTRDHLPSTVPLTSTWPHLRCDVGLEEGEYK